MLIRLILLLPAIGVALHLIGFRRTRDLLAYLASFRPAKRPALPAAATERAQGIARLVAIAARHGPYRATCLRQSLALWSLLRCRGIPAELRIGVRKEGGDFNAHAWVTHSGEALNSGPDLTSGFLVFRGSPGVAGLPDIRP